MTYPPIFKIFYDVSQVYSFEFRNELTIEDEVLKIFTALLIANVILTRPQTTKSVLPFQRSISLNENLAKNNYIFYCEKLNILF